jgi:hypothetical protein
MEIGFTSMPASGSTETLHPVGGDSRIPVAQNERPALTWRRTTADDVVAFHGQTSRHSLRANSILLDGEVVAMVGVVRHPEWGVFFSDHKPQLRPYLSSVTVWRAVKDAMTFVHNYRGPVMAISDGVEGCINLKRLGFEHLYGAWWGWLGQQQ